MGTSRKDGFGGGMSIEQELLAMSQRLTQFRDRGPQASAGELVAELETAMEELRVTGEEIAAQRRHIGELLEESTQARATVDRLVAALPTPVLITDPHGTVTNLNPAAGRLLGAAPERFKGKPLAAYIDVADRRAVRTMLSTAADGVTPEPTRVHVTPRGHSRRPVTLVAVPAQADGVEEGTGAGTAAVRWFVEVTPQGDGSAASLSLLGSFAELITVPSAAGDVADVIPRVVTIAQGALPEAADVTITVGDPRQPEQVSSSSARAQSADAAQYEAGEGPCVEAFLTDQMVGSDHLTGDLRWPALARRIRATGIDATLGVPIRGDAGVFGVLNLYGPHGAHLDDAGVRDRAELFARAASSLVQESRRIQTLREESQHLRQALVSRPEIDQAKGILMARFGYSADEAFRHLVAVSQRRNVKLRDIAKDVVAMVHRSEEQRRSGPPTSAGRTPE